MLLERGIDVSYETVRRWIAKFGPQIARNLRRRQARPGDVWYLDEVRGEMRWNQVLALARGRSAWHRSRRNPAEAPRQKGGQAPAGGIDEAIWLCSQTDNHR
jgi:transposase-like protein